MSKLYVDELHPKTAGKAIQFPAKPAFHVGYKGSWTVTTAGVPVRNNSTQSIRINQGNHWDSANNEFVAPVDGAYYFYGGFLRTSSTNVWRGFFRINGSTPADYPQYRTSEGHTSYNETQTFGHLFLLSAGDKVSFELSCDTANKSTYNDTSADYANFGGFLVG